MTKIDRLLAKHPLPTWRLPAFFIMAFLALAIGWAAFARLDEVAIAPGQVIPQGQVRVVQHLEGGIVQDILVREGERVAQDQPLVQLDLASVGFNLQEMQVRLDGLVLRRARLRAEGDGASEVSYPEAEARRRPDILLAEQRAHEGRLRQMTGSITVLAEQMRQRALDIEELAAQKKSLAAGLKLAEEQFSMSESLVRDQLTPRMEHLALQRELEDLRGEYRRLDSTLPRAKAALAEAEAKTREVELDFQRRARDELEEVEQGIARNSEILLRATDQARRATIKSPVDGVVKNLMLHTIGGVVRASEPIMEIVPSRERLVIEARIDPRDVGHIRAGQRAVVKLSTYDFIRYGGLEGEVINIAPDATRDRQNQHYFRALIETEATALGEDGSLPIIPGMVATVDIQTGDRSVLEYIIQPVLKLRSEAFRER